MAKPTKQHSVNHARDALAMIAAHGSPAEKAQVRAAVRKHFPNVGKPGPKDNDSAKVNGLEGNRPDPKSARADMVQDQRLQSMGVNIDMKKLKRKIK